MRSAQYPQPHAADQRTIVDIELQHFVHFFKQMLHVMFRMTRAVTDQPDIRIDKLQLQHFLMITGLFESKPCK